MSEVRPAVRVYVGISALLALGLTVLALETGPELTIGRGALALAIVGLLALASSFPLHFAHKTKIALDTSALFAAVLLFDPGLAMVVAGVGVAIAHVVRRDPWLQGVFNSSQSVLQAGAAGFVLTLVGWHHHDMTFSDPGQLFGLVLSAAAIYLVNTVAVSIIVSLQTGLSSWLIWRQVTRFGYIEAMSQFMLGLLTAVAVDVHAWTLPLFVLPAIAVYLSIERHLQLRQQTIDAVEALAELVDMRDPYTADHSRRVAMYAREVATALHLPPNEIDLIERAARVHDVGKIVIDQALLSKEGRLTDSEWAQLQRHPIVGGDILSRFPQFGQATAYVRHHHEAIDGSGYPDRLNGDAIPLGARIIAVADAFDAMSSARPYRPGLPAGVVLSEFRAGCGVQWDAQVVDALLKTIESGAIALPGVVVEPERLDMPVLHGQGQRISMTA